MWRMVHKIILSKIVFVSSIITIHAQEVDILYKFHYNHQIDELRSTVYELQSKYPDNLDIQYFSALFIENGDDAIKVYENLLQKAQGNLRKNIAKKIAEYYYAKGYYLSANRYQKIVLEEIDEFNSKENNVEINQTGDVVWSYKPTGSGRLEWTHDADRLPNGNTLIADTSDSKFFKFSIIIPKLNFFALTTEKKPT